MRTPTVVGAVLITAGLSFLAGRLLTPTEEVHHFYLPVPFPKGTIDPAVEQKLRDSFEKLRQGPASPTKAPEVPSSPSETPITAAKR